jgi:predicted RNase H-like HicB family nuclease
MAPEYDFTGGVRGKYAAAAATGYEVVIHDEDGQRRVDVSAADVQRANEAREKGKVRRRSAAPPLQYLVVYERAPRNYSAYVPDLPGCVAAARTKAETRRLIREAIKMHLEAMREAGEPIPDPGTSAELVEV